MKPKLVKVNRSGGGYQTSSITYSSPTTMYNSASTMYGGYYGSPDYPEVALAVEKITPKIGYIED